MLGALVEMVEIGRKRVIQSFGLLIPEGETVRVALKDPPHPDFVVAIYATASRSHGAPSAIYWAQEPSGVFGMHFEQITPSVNVAPYTALGNLIQGRLYFSA